MGDMFKAWKFVFKNKTDKELYKNILKLYDGYAVWITL